MRDLKVIETGNQSRKEFNRLKLSNIEQFLKSYPNNFEPYITPFAIIADLEHQIKFENKPDTTILCNYKDEGDIIFDLVSITENDSQRIVEYQYSGSAS